MSGHAHEVSRPGAWPGEVDERNWHATYRRTLELLHRRWLVRIIRALEPGPLRPFRLLQTIPDLQHKVLRETLRAMEAEHLVRMVIVDDGKGWELTEEGRSLIDVLALIFRWGRDHLEVVDGNLGDRG